MESPSEPFWLKVPYVILFDLLRLHRLKPWDVDIRYLLNSFLSEIKKRGYVDFSACGTALLSSAIIHRMKSELILKMEEPPRPPPEKPSEVVPPPLPFPLRFEYTSTSIEQVLKALAEVLKSEKILLTQQKEIMRAPQVLEQLDEFLANIEKNIKSFYTQLIETSQGKSLSFARLVSGMSLLEIIRAFIMLLFLANQGKVQLLQREENEDIQIQLSVAT
jgi:segregation and condensation protein A